MNAAIYARYSSTGQNEQSIDGQLRICKEFAESKGYKVVKTYIDKAKSAWSESEKRVDFQKMLADAKSGGFQHIIVYKFDRFARNRLDSQMYKQRLKKDYGIRVQSATEPVSDDEGGEIYEMFLEWNDEKYSQRLSKRVRDGFDTSVAQGKFTGGVVIFGYKLIKEPIPSKPNKFETKIVIDEQPAEIIRFIFEQYASGKDKKEIARQLNEKGLTHNGKPFKGRTFDHWLVNSKYYGNFIFANRQNENIYPPIIDKATFDRVQKRLATNGYFTRTNHTREKYLLTGKIFCGHCGGLMTADGANKKNGTVYRYYGCKATRKKLCEKKLVDKTEVEGFVIDTILTHLRNPNTVENIASKLIAYYNQRTDETAIKSVTAQIQHTETQIETTTNAFIQAVTLKNEMLQKNCDTKIKELETLLNDLKAQHTQLLFERGKERTKQDVIAFVKEVITQSAEQDEQEFYQHMIDALLRAVFAKNNGYTVWLCFDDDTPPPTLDDLRKVEEITKDFLKKKGVKPNGSTPNTYGGVGEIRTLAPVTRSTPLAGEPLNHLGTTPDCEIITL